MTQDDLGRALGVDRRRVSEVENGGRRLSPREDARLRKLIARSDQSFVAALATLAGLVQSDDT